MSGDTNSNNLTPSPGNESTTGDHLCDLTQGFSFILQTVLGLLAFSTLLIKRYREPAECRRSFWIWYLVFFFLDSTLGLLIIFILLKLVALIVHCCKWTPLKSGEYGSPFKFHYWLAQCGVYLVVMFLEKIIAGPFIIFDFWNKIEFILPRNEKLRIAIVIFIVPFIVNVLMFWIVDSLLMRKQTKKSKLDKTPSRESKAKYNKLKSMRDSGTDSEECDVLYTNMDSSSTVTDHTRKPNRKGKKSNHPVRLNMHLLSGADHR